MYLSTTRRRPAIGLVAAACLFSLALAGCGSGESGAGTSSSTPTGQDRPAALSEVPAVAALVPPEIKGKGSVNNAIYNDAPPQMFLEGGKLVGIQPDLAEAVSQVLGVKFTNIPVGSFDSIIPGLQSGRYDVAFADFGVTAERLKVVDFVEQFSLGTAFGTRKGAGKRVATGTDLCGMSLGAVAGSYFIEQAAALSKECRAAGKPVITVRTYPTQSAAVLAVSNGRVDLYASSQNQLAYTAKQGGARLEAQPFVYAPVVQACGLPKGSGLTTAVQAAMAELVRNGTYAKILDRWGIGPVAIARPEQVRINPTPES